MKIKISWSAFTNISFKGESIIEVDEEDWEAMNEQEKDEFLFEKALEASGFYWEYEKIE